MMKVLLASRVPTDMRDAIDLIATERRTTRSKVIEQLIRAAIFTRHEPRLLSILCQDCFQGSDSAIHLSRAEVEADKIQESELGLASG